MTTTDQFQTKPIKRSVKRKIDQLQSTIFSGQDWRDFFINTIEGVLNHEITIEESKAQASIFLDLKIKQVACCDDIPFNYIKNKLLEHYLASLDRNLN